MIRYRNIFTYADQIDISTHATGVTGSKQSMPSTGSKLSGGSGERVDLDLDRFLAETSPQRGATERSIGFTDQFPASDASKASASLN